MGVAQGKNRMFKCIIILFFIFGILNRSSGSGLTCDSIFESVEIVGGKCPANRPFHCINSKKKGGRPVWGCYPYIKILQGYSPWIVGDHIESFLCPPRTYNSRDVLSNKTHGCIDKDPCEDYGHMVTYNFSTPETRYMFCKCEYGYHLRGFAEFCKSSDIDKCFCRKDQICLKGIGLDPKHDTERCRRCPDGHFNDGTMMLCKPWTPCQQNEVVIERGTSERDQRCGYRARFRFPVLSPSLKQTTPTLTKSKQDNTTTFTSTPLPNSEGSDGSSDLMKILWPIFTLLAFILGGIIGAKRCRKRCKCWLERKNEASRRRDAESGHRTSDRGSPQQPSLVTRDNSTQTEEPFSDERPPIQNSQEHPTLQGSDMNTREKELPGEASSHIGIDQQPHDNIDNVNKLHDDLLENVRYNEEI